MIYEILVRLPGIRTFSWKLKKIVRKQDALKEKFIAEQHKNRIAAAQLKELLEKNKILLTLLLKEQTRLQRMEQDVFDMAKSMRMQQRTILRMQPAIAKTAEIAAKQNLAGINAGLCNEKLKKMELDLSRIEQKFNIKG